MRVFSHSSVIQFLFSFLLASVLKKAQSQQDGYQGCFDPVSGERKVTLGEPHFLCLMIGAGDDWSSGIDYIRLTFSPEADEYSRFHVPGSKCSSLASIDTTVEFVCSHTAIIT